MNCKLWGQIQFPPPQDFPQEYTNIQLGIFWENGYPLLYVQTNLDSIAELPIFNYTKANNNISYTKSILTFEPGHPGSNSGSTT